MAVAQSGKERDGIQWVNSGNVWKQIQQTGNGLCVNLGAETLNSNNFQIFSFIHWVDGDVILLRWGSLDSGSGADN